ncbi:hypothetical protein GCM10010052_07320 [Paenarthrobacter histidinolovorans]|nr:hypothetical protein GCM10010052_07320 [Paenarthrobacter histidinolovorans]
MQEQKWGAAVVNCLFKVSLNKTRHADPGVQRQGPDFGLHGLSVRSPRRWQKGTTYRRPAAHSLTPIAISPRVRVVKVVLTGQGHYGAVGATVGPSRQSMNQERR